MAEINPLYSVVFIAVGVLHPDKFPDRPADTVQRGVNHDTYESAENEGLRHLANGHWSTFTIEKRYYPAKRGD